MNQETPPTKDELHFRKGTDAQSCLSCANWSMDHKCTVFGVETLPTALCDSFTPLEGDAGGQLDGQMGGAVPDIASMLFGG